AGILRAARKGTSDRREVPTLSFELAGDPCPLPVRLDAASPAQLIELARVDAVDRGADAEQLLGQPVDLHAAGAELLRTATLQLVRGPLLALFGFERSLALPQQPTRHRRGLSDRAELTVRHAARLPRGARIVRRVRVARARYVDRAAAINSER